MSEISVESGVVSPQRGQHSFQAPVFARELRRLPSSDDEIDNDAEWEEEEKSLNVMF